MYVHTTSQNFIMGMWEWLLAGTIYMSTDVTREDMHLEKYTAKLHYNKTVMWKSIIQ